MIQACPACDKACVVHHTTPAERQSSDPEPEYSCTNCGKQFKHPNHRDAKRDTGNSTNGLAAKLHNADPNDV